MIFECSASKEDMELILEIISKKVAFSAKVGFVVPVAVAHCTVLLPQKGQTHSRK